MNIMRIQSEWQFFVKGVIIIVAVAGGAISERITLQKAVKRMETGASKASGESFDKAAAG
jgi:hypothetical protein